MTDGELTLAEFRRLLDGQQAAWSREAAAELVLFDREAERDA